MQPNPVLVEVTRGPLVESVHRGSIAVVDADGRLTASVGNVEALIYPRSSVKALQAIPLVETGGADAFGLSDAEIALCCASHSGEPGHIAAVRSILAKSGVDEAAFECGAQTPRREADAAELVRANEPARPIHNNCSGKHSGFIALARHLGFDVPGYVEPDHPVQQTIKDVLDDVMGSVGTQDTCGIDGCSVPTYAVPLKNVADGFSRFASGRGMSAARAAACRRIYAACVAEPFMVAGTDRFCTEIMSIFGGRVFVKTGAEGFFAAVFRDTGVAVALKCDDGATRASETMMAAVIEALLPLQGREKDDFARWLHPVLENRRGTGVGEVRPTTGAFDVFRDLVA